MEEKSLLLYFSSKDAMMNCETGFRLHRLPEEKENYANA